MLKLREELNKNQIENSNKIHDIITLNKLSCEEKQLNYFHKTDHKIKEIIQYFEEKGLGASETRLHKSSPLNAS